MTAALHFALAALVPVLVGPLPAAPATLTAKLCNGGTITIPLGKDVPPPQDDRCHPKACHAGTCREREKKTI